MMKLFHLEHIIETVLEDVPCPQCRSELDETLLDVRNIQENQVDIFVPCPYCGAQISVCADIQEHLPESFLRIIFPQQTVQKKLSKKHVQDISRTIQNFTEKDIRKLF